MIGPRISDAEFFSKIDMSRPGLQAIPEAIASNNYPLARRLFAVEARASLQTDRFLSIRRKFRGAHFMKDGESAAQAADRILHGELISCGVPFRFSGEVDWFSNPTFNQYKEWTWQLSRHPEWAILAEHYVETGDERMAECFVRYFRSWVRQAIVPENADGGDTLCWRTIEAGIRMGGEWPWALHSFIRSPHFTDDVLIDWYKSVWEHGWRLRNFHRTGNWLIMEMNGLAQIGILYPQFLDAPGWKAYAFERLVEELDAQIYPDGWQIELSTNYHMVDINNYQWLMDVCRAYQHPIPDVFWTAMEKMHAVNIGMMMPDGRMPDVNDGFWRPVAELMEHAAVDFPQRADFRWALTHGEQGSPPPYTSIAYPFAGYYIQRSGWESQALWALFDAGHFGYGHQHEDKLNLLLHAYGRLLLTEGGNYAYDTSEMRRYVLSTRAHNTMRVDGQDQNRRKGYNRDTFDVRTPSDGVMISTEIVDVARGQYTEGYGPDALPWVRHVRKVIFLKQEIESLGPCWIVIDRVSPDSRREVQVLWHLLSSQANIIGRMAVTSEANLSNLAVIPAQESNFDLRLVCGQEGPEFQGWMSVRNNQQGDSLPVPTLLCECEIESPVRLVTLLYPLYPSEHCPVETVSASNGHNSMDIRIQMTNGQTIEINEGDYPLA